jgi:hypothetical protein
LAAGTIKGTSSMTLHADIFREVLLQVECRPRHAPGMDLQINGHNARTISEHVRLLRDAGHLEARIVIDSDGEFCKPVCLTSLGRTFLDAAIYDMVWETAKDALREKDGDVTVDALSAALRSVAPPTLEKPS